MKITITSKIIILLAFVSAMLTISYRPDFFCRFLDNSLGCYEANLKFRSEVLGTDSSKSYLESLFSRGLINQGQCHTLAHGVGRDSAKSGSSMIEAMEDSNSFCGWGFFHGVVEGLFGSGAGHGGISQEAYAVCEGLPDSDPIKTFNCYHALGHGFYYIDANLEKSLDRCDIGTTESKKEFCRDGVFMADTFVPDSRYSPEAGSEAVLSKCSQLDKRFRRYCYWRAIPILVFDNKPDLPPVKTLLEISGGILPAFRGLFWNGFGRELDSRMAGNDDMIRLGCENGRAGGYYLDCMMGAAWHMVFYDKGDKERSLDFCRQSLSADESAKCKEIISRLKYPGI